MNFKRALSPSSWWGTYPYWLMSNYWSFQNLALIWAFSEEQLLSEEVITLCSSQDSISTSIITFALIVLEEIYYFILEKEKYVWARPVQIEVLSSVTVKWDCLQAPVTYDSKYTENMLIRLSAMVSYAEADERLQTMFSSILFYCRELKARILIFCSIFLKIR